MRAGSGWRWHPGKVFVSAVHNRSFVQPTTPGISSCGPVLIRLICPQGQPFLLLVWVCEKPVEIGDLPFSQRTFL